jgi:VWFA-related protein
MAVDTSFRYAKRLLLATQTRPKTTLPRRASNLGRLFSRTPMPNSPQFRPYLALLAATLLALPAVAQGQQQPKPPAQQQEDPNAGPTTTNGDIIIPKKKQSDEPPPPPAPEEPRVKNPNNETFSLRVDVPIVNLDVNVVLDKTHQFVPGLKAANFLVLEDGVEQKVQSVRIAQTPITAVMLLEFAANSYYYIHDMQNTAVSFFHSLRPNDYIAVVTYDLRTHILTDFTNNKDTVAQSIQSLTLPGFSDTNLFDALYETLDRTSRIEGRKYIILIGTGRDTFSKITLDKILAKIKATPNVTIFTIATGGLVNEMNSGGGGMSAGIANLNYLQAQNQLKTFAEMTGGLSFNPLFQGALPDVFKDINNSIRNQYVITYRPLNTANDGSFRKVKVLLVDNEGHPLRMEDEKGKPLKYSITARDGYNAKRPVE